MADQYRVSFNDLGVETIDQELGGERHEHWQYKVVILLHTRIHTMYCIPMTDCILEVFACIPRFISATGDADTGLCNMLEAPHSRALSPS